MSGTLQYLVLNTAEFVNQTQCFHGTTIWCHHVYMLGKLLFCLQ